MRIPGLHGTSIRDVARRTYEQFNEDDVLAYAASLAFYGLLALFPFLIFLLTLVTFLDLPQLLERILDWASTVVPRESMDEITNVLRQFHETGNAGLLSLGAAGAILAASGGVRAAMNVLNQAYDVEEGRPLWKKIPLSIAYTLGLGVLILTAAALMLIGPRAIAWMVEQTGLSENIVGLWRWLRYPVAIVLLMLATSLAYSLLPNVRRRFRWIGPGAVLAVPLWVLLSLGFRLYVDNFGRYNVMYGSLGAVIVLLLYLWLSSVVLLLGGEVNAVVERGGAERTRTPPQT